MAASWLASIPTDALLTALSHLRARDIAAVREVARNTLSLSDVVAVCARIGGREYDSLLKAALRARGVALPGARLLVRDRGEDFGIILSTSSPRSASSSDKQRKHKQGPPRRAATAAAELPRQNETRPAAATAVHVLRTAELQRISDGLNRAQEDPGNNSSARGYWLSKNWISHARRYCEACRSRLLSQKEHQGPVGSSRRSRGRSSSEFLPPWPDANADLLCEHGALAPRSVPRAKRLLVDRATWRAVANRFPLSTKFKASTAAECRACLDVLEARVRDKARERSRLEDEKRRRLSELDGAPAEDRSPRALSPSPLECVDELSTSGLLRGLLARDRVKRGVPLQKLAFEIVDGDHCWGAVPLKPGRYHLVPRAWLQKWRASLRSATAPRPGPPTTSDLLCVAHGLPLVSPHLEAYLAGDVPHLHLAHAASSEIVDSDEWRALNALFPVDFAVAFDVASHISGNFTHIDWPTEPCRLCDARRATLDVKLRPRDAKRLGKSRYQEDDALCF